VIALNQVAQTRVDPRGHANVLDTLVAGLRKRPGVVFLKRLTIVLDEDSEKGFGLVRCSARSAYMRLYACTDDG
jgi:ribonuclease P/MRP protein subunit RPP1